MKKITFITCWWTIDKDYSILNNAYDFIIWKPRIKNILENIRLWIDIEIIELMKKDSLDMNENDRNKVLETVNNVDTENIIITHGTDTMIQTANKLENIKNKRIIFVGSSKPQIFKDTDADFNIWFCFWSIEILEKNNIFWTYITMNWKLFDINNVIKDEDGIFKTIKK